MPEPIVIGVRLPCDARINSVREGQKSLQEGVVLQRLRAEVVKQQERPGHLLRGAQDALLARSILQEHGHRAASLEVLGAREGFLESRGGRLQVCVTLAQDRQQSVLWVPCEIVNLLRWISKKELCRAG